MITVIETWYLKNEYAQQALEIMQEMDDLLDQNAHAHPGWASHAAFYQRNSSPNEITMIYSWKSKESHQDLVKSEEGLLQDFNRKYCLASRNIEYFSELEVEV